ncbi:tyrosine-type recombinase/integrase [Gloeocapsa sp. BRSZ]
MEYSDPLPELKLVLLVPDGLLRSRRPQYTPPSIRTRPANDTAEFQLAPDDSRWLIAQEFLNSGKVSPNSRWRYETELKRFFHWTQLPLREITTDHLSQYQTYLVEAPRTMRNKAAGALNSSSINSACSIIQSFLTWLLKTNHKDFPPDNFKRVIVPLEVSNTTTRILTETELSRIWEALESFDQDKLRNKAIICVLSHGLTMEEAIALNVDSFKDGSLCVMTGSTGKVRLIPLDQKSIFSLENYLNWRQEQENAPVRDTPLFIYHSKRFSGQRLQSSGFRQIIRRIGEISGIPDLKPVYFRQTYTAGLLQKLHPLQVTELTGYGWRELKRYFSIDIPQDLLNQECERASEEMPYTPPQNLGEILKEILERNQ